MPTHAICGREILPILSDDLADMSFPISLGGDAKKSKGTEGISPSWSGVPSGIGTAAFAPPTARA
jgi:hypothetical protein